MPRFALVVLFATVLIGRGKHGGAQSPGVWPQFRGVNASGVATDSANLPVEFGPDTNVLWAVDLPPGVSSPCIMEDRVYVTAFDEAASDLLTICIDRADGSMLWRRVAPVEEIEQFDASSSPANATPAAAGDQVYVYFGSCGLLCYDRDGDLRWSHSLPSPDSPFGTGTSPIVVEGRVILNHDLIFRQDAGASYLLALDARSGEEAWRSEHPSQISPYPTPIHLRRADVDYVLLLSFGQLTAYRLDDGQEAWKLEGLPGRTVGTPVLGGGRIYLSATGAEGEGELLADALPSYDELVSRFDQNQDGLAPAEIPANIVLVRRNMSGGAGDTLLRDHLGYGDQDGDQVISREEWTEYIARRRETFSNLHQGVFALALGSQEGEAPEILWSESRGAPELPSPLYVDGRVYSVKNGGVFYCRDAATGETIYRGRVGAPGGYFASPVFGDGKIYLASDQGQVAVLAAGDRLKVLKINDFGERIVATPALVEGVIYVRTDSRLYACQQLD